MMKKSLVILIAFAMIGAVITVSAKEMNIVMGFKDQPKPPFIGNVNDNSGLYKQLFNTAAKRIGLNLEIVRVPKKRAHSHLQNGTVDFYPGASFSQSRAEYLYYLPIGFESKEVVITSINHADITDISKVSGRLLVELGSSKLSYGQKYPNLEIVQMGNLPIKNVLAALAKGRGDFFISDIEPIKAYMERHNINNEEELGIKIHYKAINHSFIPLYFGFSRKSPLFQEVVNQDFDPSNQVTISNFPTVITKECVAYKFYLALQHMKKSGEIKTLYYDYFGLN
jgi:ABC-type amino acid transport substrate-binding protein